MSETNQPSQHPATTEEVEAQRIELLSTGSRQTIQEAVREALSDKRREPPRGMSPEEAEAYLSQQLADAAEIVQRLAAGDPWGAILAGRPHLWPRAVALQTRHPRYKALVMLAKETGEAIRQARREAEADRRAVEGYDEPVYWRGELQGYIRRYSDKLMELLLRAGDPAKFGGGDAKGGGTGSPIVFNFVGMPTPPPPKPVTNTSPTDERPPIEAQFHETPSDCQSAPAAPAGREGGR